MTLIELQWGCAKKTAPLAINLVDHVLWRHFLGVHILAQVEVNEVVALSAEGVVGMQFRTLAEDKIIGGLARVDAGDLVVV